MNNPAVLEAFRTDVNLIEKEIISLMNAILTNRNQSTCVFRIDSTPIEAFLRKTNRMCLTYLTLAMLVKSKVEKEIAVNRLLKHYLKLWEYNRLPYDKRETRGSPSPR